uniref:Uncharacterized protein n=1 Tax=Romanomermis culicivorax TaxID=13658 RepID=A0A915L0D5_ROMCU
MAGGGNKRFVKPSGPFSRQPTSTSASNASPRVAGGATSPRFAAQQPTQTQPQSPAANAGVYASTAAAATSHDRSPVQSNIHNGIGKFFLLVGILGFFLDFDDFTVDLVI